MSKIVIFAYRRWSSVEKILRDLTSQGFKDITIYVDGAKGVEDFNDVNKVIEITSSFNGVRLIKRPVNWGMYYNIVDGLLSTLDEEFLVLEEDLEVSNLLLIKDLCPSLLTSDTFSISLMSYLKNDSTRSLSYFELERFFCWGWYARRSKLIDLEWNRIRLSMKFSAISTLRHGDLNAMYYDALIRKSNSWAAIVSKNIISKGWNNIMFRGGMVKNKGYDGENMNSKHRSIFRQYYFTGSYSKIEKVSISILEYWKIHWRFRKFFKMFVYGYEVLIRTVK